MYVIQPLADDMWSIHKSESAQPGQMGIVEVKGTIDDPGAPDHGEMVYCERNTITFTAREIMAHCLAGVAAYFITTIGWGTGTTAPQRSDTALQTPAISSAVVSPAGYPTIDSVVFTSTLPPGVGTGLSISEVVLQSTNGKAFARFVFPAQQKFDRLRLSVNWQIIFV